MWGLTHTHAHTHTRARTRYVNLIPTETFCLVIYIHLYMGQHRMHACAYVCVRPCLFV